MFESEQCISGGIRRVQMVVDNSLIDVMMMRGFLEYIVPTRGARV